MATQMTIKSQINEVNSQIDFYQSRGCSPLRAIQALRYYENQLEQIRQAEKSSAIAKAQAERDAFKQERGVNARFECNGTGHHNVCGLKCKHAQRVGAIDV